MTYIDLYSIKTNTGLGLFWPENQPTYKYVNIYMGKIWDTYRTNKLEKDGKSRLGGGFNPSEKSSSNWTSPSKDETEKDWNHHLLDGTFPYIFHGVWFIEAPY